MNKGALILVAVVLLFVGTLVYLVRDATSTLDQASYTAEIEPVPQPIRSDVPAPATAPITEQDLSLCEVDSDCIIVPYAHCCGATKRAINQKWGDLYYGRPEWQRFDNETLCSVIGRCLEDDYVTAAICEPEGSFRRCRLKFP